MSHMEAIYKRLRDEAADENASVGVAFSLMDEMRVKAAERDQPMLITAVATTPRVDLDDEVVDPRGLNPATFQRLKAVYYNHSYAYDPLAQPIAALRYTKSLGDQGWRVQMSMLPTQLAQDVGIAVQHGAIRGTSIGYKRLDWGQPDPDEIRKHGPHTTITRKADWIELSITPMPCNPDAMIDGAGLPDEAAKALEGLAMKGRISRESAYAMGLPKPRVMLQVKRRLFISRG